MPTLPWTAPKDAPAVEEAYVMASRLEVASLRAVPRFFLRSLVAWRQVKAAPGLLGASMVAEPLKRTFWTLSAWDGRSSLYEYARTEPHAGIMRGLRPVMRRTTFVTWTVPAGELPLDWAAARARLLEELAAA